MTLSALKRSEATEKERQGLTELSADLDACVAETRTISHLLHPPLLDELGLRSAVGWYVEEFSKRSGIKANLHVPQHFTRLPGTLELVLFRVLQESLVNVHRHSHSQSVDIKLEQKPHNVILEVRDHGQGIPPELLERFTVNGGGGVGLRSMRGRISEVSGRLDLQSDKKGTLIRVTVPLRNAKAKLALASPKVAGA